MSARPIVVTPGEPAGIGPDLLLQLAAPCAWPAPIVVVADRTLLEQRAQQLGLQISLPAYEERSQPAPPISLISVALNQPCQPGQPNPANASYVMETIRLAVRYCLEKKFSALVTGPVNKAILQQGGIHFLGHTELLAELTGVDQTV